MPATDINYEQSYPIGEYYTYYPTWANGPVPTPTQLQTQYYGGSQEVDVVVSGVSGRFPESENIEEFSKYLYGSSGFSSDVTKNEFSNQNYKYQSFNDLTLFDYSFFGIGEKQAKSMDPQLRCLLETTYEAIFDSGFNPCEIKNTNTGVFIGTTGSQYETTTGYNGMKYADEIGRYFEFNGPFFTIDITQSSGLIALDKAVCSIRSGLCEQAIVGGINFNFDKYQQQFEGNFTFSQFYYGTVGVVFIQKCAASRRFYAKILNSKSYTSPINGEKDYSFASTNGEYFMKLLRQMYNEWNIDPSLVSYFETHGFDQKIFDSNEYKYIADIFGKNRNVPLFVGSTKSTCGNEHGIISLVKILIAAHKGIIPASLKYQQPTGENYGRLQFITENTQFFGGLMALNSFGYRGTSVHMVFQPNSEQLIKKYGPTLFWNQDLKQYYTKPRLFQFSARTEEGLLKIFEQMYANSDLATQFLLNPNAYTSPVTHPYRGYTILNSNKKVREFKKISCEKRPLYFLFNGFGTQWYGMGRELMQIEYFASTIQRIADFYKLYAFDFMQYFTNFERVQENPFYSLVLITAIQVAFVDLMKYFNIIPDGFVGYSFGEFVCAYADNALTFEETLLAVYHLGKLFYESHLPESSMATIGLSYEEAIKQCPQSIVPSIYETKDTVIVSGPKKQIQQFVEQLIKRGVYAKECDLTYNFGLHSYLMAPIASQYKTILEKIIRHPKLRSQKWYSTSYLPNQQPQQLEQFKYASPEYFINNLINPVYFYQVISHLPTNAITVEFGPHAYLQPILSRILGDNFTYINFMKRDSLNHYEYFLTSFGRFYNEGYNVDSLKLFLTYRKEYQYYPVPSCTRFLSPLVSWYRPYGKYYTPKYEEFEFKSAYNYPFTQFKQPTYPYIDTNQFIYRFDITKGSQYEYFSGNKINDKIYFPTSGYLFMVWDAFAKLKNKKFYEVPVAFENLEFLHPFIFEVPNTEFIVKFVDVTIGRFEITYNDQVCVSGRIYSPLETSIIGSQEYYQATWLAKSNTDLLEQEEIYREFKIRGYEYLDIFQGIYKTNTDGTRGELYWCDNWISFLESMIQVYLFGRYGLQYPTRINSIRIDPKSHCKYMIKSHEHKNYLKGMMPFTYDEYTKTYVSGGVEMNGFFSKELPKLYIEQPVTLERVKFVPYFEHYGQDAQFDEFKPDFEYIDSYINEIRYYVGEILHKIECSTIKPTQQQQQQLMSHSTSFESFSLQTNSYRPYTSIVPTPTQYNGKIIESKFIELLKEACKFEVNDQYLHAVKQLFCNDYSFYKLFREEAAFYYSGGRYAYLKTILDTVYENVCNTKMPSLKVLEIAPQFYSFGSKINEFFGVYPSINIDYHYAPVGEFYPELFNECVKNSQFPITKVEWNLKTQELPAQQQFRDYDLVIFNGSLGYLPFFEDKTMTKRWLQTISDKLVKPQGFFFVHEFVSHFDTFNQLYALEQFLFNGQYAPQRQYQPYKYQQESELRKLFDEYFYPTALKQDNVYAIYYLYRKYYSTGLPCSLTQIHMPKECEIYINDINSFDWIEKVRQALSELTYERIYLICEKAPTSGIIGLVNCLRYEPRGECIRCVFIADQTLKSQQWKTQFEYLKRGDLFINVFKYGKWGSYRRLLDFQEYETPLFGYDNKYAYVDYLKRGDLSTLQWIQSPEPIVKDASQTLVNVMYSGLNYRDYLYANGLYKPEYLPTYYKKYYNDFYYYGMEFCGYSKDKRYMGITPSRGLATHVIAYNKYLWEIPQTWSFEQAATVPLCYAQAYYALVVRGGLKHGETVFVNYGATPFGQAAISIAFGYNCKVYTSIETKEEREYLMLRYPGKFNEESIVYHDEYFDRHILRYTQGKGVNVVINCYNDDKIQPSLRCLAPYGRFLEMCDYSKQYDEYYKRTPIFGKNITYCNVYFDLLFEQDNMEWEQVYKLVDEGIRLGVVRPLPPIVFESYKIQDAFKYFFDLKEKSYKTKCLIKIEQQQQQTQIKSQYPSLTVVPRFYYSPYYTYIITGGLTPFALELAQFMVERGARKLYLTTHTGICTGYQQRKLHYLQNTYGAIITLSHYNVKDERECGLLFREATELSEEKIIGGIFHLETSFFNGKFDMLKPEEFKFAFDAKYFGAYYLDKYSRKFDNCYFVVFSSFASCYGYPGASTYGYANSSIERLCELRRQDGKHAVAIQFGKIGEFDSVFETKETECVYNGTLPQKIYSALHTLEYILLRSKYNTIWSTFVPSKKYTPNMFVDYFYPQYYYPKQLTTYQFQLKNIPKSFSVNDYQSTFPSISESLISFTPRPKFHEYVYKLLNIGNAVRFNLSLVHYGLDNLLAEDVRMFLEKYYHIKMTAKEIQELTLGEVRSFDAKYYQSTKFNYLMPKRLFEKLNDVEVTQKMHPVFVLHPIEGHVNMLKSWAKYMKYPIYGIQYTCDAFKYDSIEKLAEYYFQQIDTQFGHETRFHLIGYSFGGSVAFEMALRNSGRIASLTFLDSSYMYVNPFINSFKSKYLSKDLATIESEFLYGFVSQYTQLVNRSQFVQELISLSSYDNRVQYAIKYLMKVTQFNFDLFDIEQAAKAYVQRMFMSYRYQPKSILKYNEILLVKPTQKTEYSELFGEDYGLGHWVNGKISMQLVEGDHRSFLESTNGYKIATILNDYLFRYYHF